MTNLRAALHRHLASTACAVLLVTPALACAADELPLPEPAGQSVEIKGTRATTVEQVQRKAVDNARAAAVADGLSTALALSSGAIEMNPLVATSPLGLLALTGAKIGLVNFAKTLPEHERRTVLKASGAIWGGAAVNNLLVLMAAPTPVAVVAGVVVGVLSWRHTARAYAAADRALAEAGQAPEQSEPAETVEVAWVPVAADAFYALR
ncbi:MAG TPA: hypothetical protein VF861_17690 [Telluria sp.]